MICAYGKVLSATADTDFFVHREIIRVAIEYLINNVSNSLYIYLTFQLHRLYQLGLHYHR